MYLKVFEVCLNVFECIYGVLNVVTNIVIRISPSHSHYKVFAMCTHLYICFSLSIMTPFSNMLYHYPLFSHFHWSIPTFIQSIKILHINSYFSCLYITSHSTFLVVRSIAEPKLIFIALSNLRGNDLIH
jgi:hypothetical protein